MFNFGQFNEYSDAVTIGDPVIHSIAKTINLNPFNGRFYQSMGAPTVPLAQKKFEIYSRSKTSRDGTIGTTAWTASGTTDLKMNADSLKGLTVGHVLRVGSEVVIIKSVSRSANTIDVLARGAGGTTAATHAASSAFKVVGFAGDDTDLKNVESMSESTSKWSNYVQTVFEVIEWTKHAELVRKGLSSSNATVFLLQEAEIRVAEMLSRMSIYGIKAQSTGVTERYMSAGLYAQLGDTARGGNVINVAGNITEAAFIAGLKTLFDKGGTANKIWISQTMKTYFDAFMGSFANKIITDSATNHTGGGIFMDKYNYQGAILDVEVDADMSDDTIAVVNSPDCKKGWLSNDGLRQADEPSPSSREIRKSIQGSVGFIVENVGVNHLLFTGITGGSTDRSVPVSVTNTVITDPVTSEA